MIHINAPKANQGSAQARIGGKAGLQLLLEHHDEDVGAS